MLRFVQKIIFKSTIIMAGVLAVAGLAVGSASALTYQQDIGVSFTFNSLLQVSLSSSDLIIPNLTPGTASDSNVITVNIKTNAVNGYTLNATVGNDTTYNTRDLKHQSSTVTNKFTSVDFGASIADNTGLADNTWAYSYNDTTIEGSTWTNYSGLPLYSDTTNIATLKATNGPVSSTNGDDINFKIAARASSDQSSGEYNNVINFQTTAKFVPTYLYDITYSDLSGEATNMPADESGSTSDDYIAISDIIPDRTGYSFMHWCSGNVDESLGTCDGDTYNPGDYLYFDSSDFYIQLTAVWEEGDPGN